MNLEVDFFGLKMNERHTTLILPTATFELLVLNRHNLANLNASTIVS